MPHGIEPIAPRKRQHLDGPARLLANRVGRNHAAGCEPHQGAADGHTGGEAGASAQLARDAERSARPGSLAPPRCLAATLVACHADCIIQRVIIVLGLCAVSCLSEGRASDKWDAWVADHSSCSEDADCALVYPGCPLGCVSAVNAS